MERGPKGPFGGFKPRDGDKNWEGHVTRDLVTGSRYVRFIFRLVQCRDELYDSDPRNCIGCFGGRVDGLSSRSGER